MSFKKFIPGKRMEGKEKISISKKILFFNAPFIRNNHLEEKSNVEIFIENLNYVIKVGFSFKKDNTEDSLKISKATKGDSKFGSAVSLFKELNKLYPKFEGNKFNSKKEKTEFGELFVIEIEKE